MQIKKKSGKKVILHGEVEGGGTKATFFHTKKLYKRGKIVYFALSSI